MLFALLGLVILGAVGFSIWQKYAGVVQSTKPNIIVFMTDDQRFDSMGAMPITKSRLGSEGVTFMNAFIPTPLCCPSRTSFLTGLYSHNTGIWRNNPPEGGFESFHNDSSTIAVLLHNAGYKTALFGKYLNGYHKSDYVPPGWDEWQAFNKGNYYGYQMNENGKQVQYGYAPQDYSGTVILKKAVAFLKSMRTSQQPFFLVLTPNNPHGDSGKNIDEVEGARPAPQDEQSCQHQTPYRPPNFNEADVSDKPSFVKSQKLLTPKQIAEIDQFHDSQICSLKYADEMVGKVLDALGKKRENTMVVFYSDNGYAYGEHRNKSKNCLYEECIRVPLIISYPPLTTKATVSQSFAAANIDVMATILDIAGVTPKNKINGVSLKPILENPTASVRDDFVIEVYNNKISGKDYGIRTKQYKYIENATGEKELYDLIQDPFELINLAGKPEYKTVVSTLSSKLAKMEVE